MICSSVHPFSYPSLSLFCISPQTAHFVIPHNIRHGEDLVCSYEACRNAGNKFRYCAECRIPVAKRNFHQRHGHNLQCVNTASEQPKQARTAAPKSKKNKAATKAEAAKVAKKQEKKRKPLTPKQQSQQQMESSTDSSSDGTQPAHKRRKMEGAPHAASSSDFGPLFPEVGDIPLARQLRWATLLGKRPDPDDADGMSAWLLEVMTVSDLNSPLGTFASSSLTNSGSGEDDIFGESNSDSPEMGSSVNSSLSTDVLTSDVSSEEALPDPDTKVKVLGTAEDDRKMAAKPSKERRKQHRHQQQKESKKDAGKAVRRQEKKRKAQKGREDKEKRKNKKRRSIEMEQERSASKKKSKSKKAKSSSTKKTTEASLKAVGLSESQVKMVQEENAKSRQEELSNDSPDNEELSASYAEWQERKKQKALTKTEAPDAAMAAETTASIPVKAPSS